MDPKRAQPSSGLYLSLSDYLNDRSFCRQVLDLLVSPNGAAQNEAGFSSGNAVPMITSAAK